MRSNDDDDVPAFRPPPPLDDRLWRHPSEVTSAVRQPSWSARHSFGLAALSALGGALFTSALWLAFAAPDNTSVRVKEQVALAPVIAVQPKLVSTDDWSTEVSTRASNALFSVEVHAGSTTRTGAALAVIDDGHLVVPAHLLIDAKSVFVITREGSRLPATITGVDTVNDIGVIKVGVPLPIAVVSRIVTPDVGQTIALVGADGTSRPVWQTSVLSVDQRAPLSSSRQALFRVDASIDPSADGGAVVDATGAVVGIATIPPQASARDGFAIPMSLARSIAWDLINSGTTTYPSLGFDGARTEGVRDRDAGVRVLNTTGPATIAGLQKDDIVTAADGTPMTSMAALIMHARERGAGNPVVLDVLRKEKQISITLTLSSN
ncbi:MAG: S1C family serine protease [Acidimicrobiales bacterium]